MTISSTTVKNSYSGNGTLDTFNYTFKIFADTDLEVIIRDASATETVKTLTTHYTVTGAGSASGGTIVFTSGNIPSATETVVIRRAVPQTQAIDYIANDPFPAESHEEGLDRAMMTLQQVQEEVDRSIKLSRTNTMNSTEFTVGDTDRANKVFGFDASGELTVAQELGTFKGNWSSGTTFAVRDIIKDTSNNNVYICLTAHTSSGSQPISTNADVAKWGLLVDAASATTSATAAAASASAAATSESNAATSESNAATSETNSANSATASANSATSSASSATASASSATAAAGSASAAEATFDLFDDSYLGAKASNPTVDNDGDALQDGALYFDTTNDVMKVYNLANTTWYQLTPTVSNQTNINTVAGISSDVSSVAGISSDVTTTASNTTNISTVAGQITPTNNVSTLAGISSNVSTVAGIASNVTSVAGISSNVTTVAGISSDVSAVAGDATDIGTVATNLTGTNTIGTVAGSIANVNNVGGSIANVNTVGSNIGTVNEFGERYRVEASAPTTSLDIGDLYFDTSTSILNVYGTSGWQNAGSSVNGTSQRYNYTATSGQTTFTGADNGGNTLAYDAGFIDVYLNGVKLLNGTDVTVTSGTSVVLASGATTGDVVDIVAYGTFSVASLNADNLTSGTVPSARVSGAYTGITQTGTLASFASTGIDDNATSTAITIDSNENIGIGETSPTSHIHLKSGGNTTVRFQGNVGGSLSTLLLSHPSTADAGLQFNSNQLNMFSYSDIAFFPDQANISGSYPNGEKMRIRHTGNVGIGTSSPSAKLHVDVSNSGVTPNSYANTLFIESSSNTGLTIASGTSSYSSIYFANSTDNDKARIEVVHSDNSMRFTNNASERMRIDSSGNVGIGTSSPTTRLRVIGQISTQSETNGNGFSQNCIGTPANYYFDVRDDGTGIFRIISNKRIQTNGGTTMRGHLNLIGERGQNFIAMAFEHTGGGGEVGSISTTSSSTSFNTSSDYRLKENVSYDFDATTRLKQLKPARFNFIADADTTVDGFLAHEVSNIVPEAISGEKDAVQVWEEGDELPEGVSVGDNKLDENGNTIPQYQGIDQSKLVPLLVKTIQELEARITTLENA